MKKNFKLLTMTAVTSLMVTTVDAAVFPAYSENFNAFEGNASFVEAGIWGSNANMGQLIVAEDPNMGKQLTFTPSGNGNRSFYCNWGLSCWADAEAKDNGTDNYYVSMEFAIKEGADRYANQIYIATSEEQLNAIKGKNDPQSIPGSDFAFNMFELSSAELGAAPNDGVMIFYINDSTKTITLNSVERYELSLMIDTLARTSKWKISSKLDGSEVGEGVYNIPDTVPCRPTGMFCCASRSSGNIVLDNIKVGKWTDVVVVDKPVYTWAKSGGVEDEMRCYDLICGEEDVVHYLASDGATVMCPTMIDDYTGMFTIQDINSGMNTIKVLTSGKITIWSTRTVDGSEYKSEEVSFDVECGIVTLPEPEFKITGVKEGYEKEYTINIDNSNVPSNPNIYFKYYATNANGDIIASDGGVDQPNGTKIVVAEKCEITAWSVLYGYEPSNKTIIPNDSEYEITQVIDFEHMTPEQMEAKGFVQQDDWVGPYSEPDNKNRWVQIGFAMSVNVCSNGVDTAKYHIVSGQEYVDPLTVQRYQLEATSATIDSATACSLFAPLVLPSANLSSPKVTKEAPFQIIKNMGLMINTTAAGNDIPFAFRGLRDDQYALVYKINSYGRYQGTNYVAKGAYSSFEEAAADKHGILSHVIKGNGSFNLWRYDTVITRIEIMSAKGGNPISDLRVDLEDPNAPIYNLQGILMDCSKESLPKGIYLQNGKKFLVK